MKYRIRRMTKRVSVTDGERMSGGIKIPVALIERLRPFGPRYIKVEPPLPDQPKTGKKAVEVAFQDHPYEADDPTLQEWLMAGGNYGILAGKGIIIIETDTKETAEKLARFNTLTTLSGSGRGNHCIFRSNITENGVLIDAKGENVGNIQAHNKYVVGPNCKHFTGGTYKIINDAPIAWISKEELEEIFKNELSWAGKRRREIEEEAQEEQTQIGTAVPLEELIDLSEFRLISKGEYQGAHPVHGSEGGQNFCVNTEKNLWHCFRCNSGGGGLTWIAVKHGILQCREAQKGALKGKKFMETLKLAAELGFDVNLFEEKISPDVARFYETDEQGRPHFVPALVAVELMKENQYVTRKTDEMVFRYIPEKGIYEMFAEAHIKTEARKKLGKHLTTTRHREIEFFIKASTLKDLEEAPKHLIAVQNGVLNIETMKLEPFNPDYLMFNALPVNYDPQARCPKYEKFLSEVVTPKDAEFLQEFLGYCLLRDCRFEKALILIGEGANGKSTLIYIWTKALGDENISNEPLQILVTNRFALGGLYGKLVNAYPDLPAIALKDTGLFKSLVTGERVSAEYKFRNRFSFYSYAKLLFSANRMPETPDDTTAFFRRWGIINFPNQFLPDNPKTDPNLKAKLTTPEELSGILNWALEGLKRLLTKGKFSIGKTIEETREQYIRASDPAKAFAIDCIEFRAGNYVPKDTVYSAFLEYCQKLNLPAMPKNAFAMKLTQHVPTITSERKGPEGKKVWYYGNIVLQERTAVTTVSTEYSITVRNHGDTSKHTDRRPSDETVVTDPQKPLEDFEDSEISDENDEDSETFDEEDDEQVGDE